MALPQPSRPRSAPAQARMTQAEPGKWVTTPGHCRERVGRAWVRTELRLRNTETGQDLSGSVSVCRALGNMNMANGSPDGDMAQLLIICGSRGLMGNDYKYV